MRTIDADAALKALRKCQTYLYDARDPELKIELSSAEAAINNLPTIQSQSTAQSTAQSTDLIDRQQAIDALDCISGVEEVLKSLPSVQPERTCVNCGRTVNNGGWYADGGTRCPIEEHYALPKDGFCHLWEKRNVTDDDYPERRTYERSNQQTGGDFCNM